MLYLTHIFILLSLILSNLVKCTPPALTLVYADTQEVQVRELVTTATDTAQKLTHQFMEALDTIDFSLHFWQLQLESSIISIASHAPTLFLKPHFRKTIASHLTHLRNEQEYIACCLGRLYSLKAQTPPDSAPLAIQAEYSTKVVSLLQECLNPSRFYSSNVKTTITIPEMQSIFTELTIQINAYQTVLADKLKEHWAPPRLVRNCVKYATISAATVAALVYLYKNRHNLGTWYNQAKNGLDHFWREHIATHLKKTYELFFVETHQSIGDKEAYVSKEAFAQDRYKTILSRLRPSITEDPELLAKEIQNSLVGKGHIVNEEWNIQAQKPFYNALAGSLIQLFEARYIIPYDLKIANVEILIDEIYKALRLHIQLLGVMPAIFGGLGTVWVGKTLFNGLKPSFSHYEVIQHGLRNLHILCVLHSSTRKCEIDRYNGYLCYWLHKLLGALPSLPVQHRVPFKEDLRLLADHSLSCEQHLMILNRMYATYPFLKA